MDRKRQVEKPSQSDSKVRKRQRLDDDQIRDLAANGDAAAGCSVFSWTPSAVLAPLCPGGSASVAASVCRLFAEGNSVPFIARYRRPQTGGMTPDDLRNE